MAETIIAEADELSSDDKIILREAVNAITTDGPQTQLGVGRIKRLMQKGVITAGSVLYKVALDVATEAAKKAILGSSSTKGG